MSSKIVGYALFCLAIFVGLARPTEPAALLLPPILADNQKEAGKDKPKVADKDKKLTEPPKADFFTQAPPMGGQFPTGFNPHMLGDFPGAFARRTFTVTGFQTITTTVTGQEDNSTLTTTVKIPISQTRTILVPIGARGAFKVAENASPRPQDRVFFTYNYYGGLHGANAPNDAFTSNQNSSRFDTVTFGFDATVATNTSTVFPATPLVSANQHREVAGFEKTFLDGFASIELRIPCVQQQSNLDGFNSSNVGDLTLIGKYAFVLDDAGNVFAAGLGLTVPTGPRVETIDGNVHATLLQPWLGYIRNFDRFYVQGFHSVVCPTDPRDVTLLFNDVSVNWWLYRATDARPLRFIVPSLEAHVTTPLNHRDGTGPIFAPDLVVLTGGIHFGLFDRTTLSLAVASPVTGPRLFNIEAFLQLNWRF